MENSQVLYWQEIIEKTEDNYSPYSYIEDIDPSLTNEEVISFDWGDVEVYNKADEDDGHC